MKKNQKLDPEIREYALSLLQVILGLDKYPLTKEQKVEANDAIMSLIGIGIADRFLKVRASLFHHREQYENLLPLEAELNEEGAISFYIREKPTSQNMICLDIGNKLSCKNFRKKKI